jgi:sigma-B regulation protein RsbU (phosphoserine phosphatase)
MLLNLTELSSETLDEQISKQIIEKILAGKLASGSELLPIPILAREHHVNKTTVRKAYNLLQDQKVIEFKNDYGYYVCELGIEQKENLIMKYYTNLHSSSLDVNKNILEVKQMEEELKFARQIQADLLPTDPLIHEKFSIAAFIEPSRVVCGDFYDYFPISENKFGFVIADASGKGMPAAILISQIQAILKCEVGNGTSIQKTMKKFNNHLNQNCSAKNFTTLFYGIYNSVNNVFEYSNAGHNCPILIHENGSFELLKTTGPALGLINDFDFTTNSVDLMPGDNILFCTDGITETMNEVNEQFGEGRLIELLIRNKSLNTEEIISQILTELNEFKSSEQLQDDKTIMIFKYCC